MKGNMKHFIQYRILPFLIPLVFFTIASALYFIIYNSKVESKLHTISQYECLIMGDSQMQRINPNKLSLKSLNFASQGEHYFYTFQKLKKTLEFSDSKIKQIILGVSLHSFSPVYCRLISTAYPEGRSSLSRYLYFIELTSDEYLNRKDILSVPFIKGIYRGPDWGGLRISNYRNPDSTIIFRTISEHYSIRKTESLYDPEQIKYLFKIEDLCRNHGIELWLISVPYHPVYIDNIDNYYTDILKSTIDSMNYAKYICYLDTLISPDLMSDGAHLNWQGSDMYTKYIDDTICK
jgi:hypothetical protein